MNGPVVLCVLDGFGIGDGGDTDGQGGRDGAPHEIDTVADYHKLEPILQKRGYSADDVDNIMWKNWKRFFSDYLP